MERPLIRETSCYTDLLANNSMTSDNDRIQCASLFLFSSVRVPWWLFLFRVPWWLFSFSGFVVLRKSAHLLRCTDRWYTWRTVRYQISQSKPLHVCDNIYHHQVQEVQDLSLVLSSSLSAPATNTIILFCYSQSIPKMWNRWNIGVASLSIMYRQLLDEYLKTFKPPYLLNPAFEMAEFLWLQIWNVVLMWTPCSINHSLSDVR